MKKTFSGWPLVFWLAAILCPISSRGEIQYVIAISVDGLRGDFLQAYVDGAPDEFPNFVRLRNASAFTYQARCDYDFSETVPNHLAMITGRPVLQPGGQPTSAYTGFTSNVLDGNTTDTVHVYRAVSGMNSGPYKASIFDVVHDHGLSTALYLGKMRLAIVERSFNATHGALDVVGADNGRAKIDFMQVQDANTTTLVSTLGAHIAGSLERFTLLHITDPDGAGHSFGWTNTNPAYRNSIKTTDGYLGSILNALAANPALAGKVAVLLTGDHGGGGSTNANSHTDATRPGNYTVPFFVFAPGIPGGSDLYALFENRVHPGTSRPAFTDPAQPVHNADIANLSAALLGLPVVPGSFLLPELEKPLEISHLAGVITVSWPLYLTGYTLEFSGDLSAASWRPLTSGILEDSEQRSYSTVAPQSGRGFFRLRKP